MNMDDILKDIRYLNEEYIAYYRKYDLPMIYPFKLHSASSMMHMSLEANDRYAEDVNECFMPALNSPYSLTSIIRKCEKNCYYLHEDEIAPCLTRDAVDMWKRACKNYLDSRLHDLSFNDVKIKVSGADAGSRIVDFVNCSASDRKKDVMPLFQLICPISKSKDNAAFAKNIILAFLIYKNITHGP